MAAALSPNDGGAASFGFFNIWTDEPFVNSDAKSPASISATLDFAVPNLDATITGDTYGIRVVKLWGLIDLQGEL